MRHSPILPAVVAVAAGAVAVLLLIGEGLTLPLAVVLVCPLVVLVVVDTLRPGWTGQATPAHLSDTDQPPRQLQEGR